MPTHFPNVLSWKRADWNITALKADHCPGNHANHVGQEIKKIAAFAFSLSGLYKETPVLGKMAL